MGQGIGPRHSSSRLPWGICNQIPGRKCTLEVLFVAIGCIALRGENGNLRGWGWRNLDLPGVWLIRLAVTLDRLSGETEGGKPTHQKQGYSGAQDEAGNHVGAVVPVLRDPIEARQEGRAEGPQAQHGFGQTTALCLDCACDVHLEQDGDP